MAADHDLDIPQPSGVIGHDHHPTNGVGEDVAPKDERLPGPAGPQEERTYTYDGESFPTERAMLTRFLDDYRAAERFGAIVLAEWVNVAQEPTIRRGLRTICAREQRHSELLADRLREIGGECRAELTKDLQDAARERLASPGLSDLEKLEGLFVCYADIETSVRPIRAVIAQIDQDLETKALLDRILDGEIATLRWLSATCGTLVATATRPRRE